LARRGDAPGAILEVIVTPRASAESLGPFRDGLLHVKVTRPPADGEANRAVSRLLATALGLALSDVVLAGGERARRKRFRLEGMTPAQLTGRLAALAQGSSS
jgi:uncharacterized protein YggU (UPF0235/DUF167 family)